MIAKDPYESVQTGAELGVDLPEKIFHGGRRLHLGDGPERGVFPGFPDPERAQIEFRQHNGCRLPLGGRQESRT